MNCNHNHFCVLLNLDVAMDYLLELSTAAKETPADYSRKDSGFDSIATSLEGAMQFVEVDDALGNEFAQFGSSLGRDLPDNTLLTEDFDSLIQNEFEKCSLDYYVTPNDSGTGCPPETLDSIAQTNEPPSLVSSSVTFNAIPEGVDGYDCFFSSAQDDCPSSQPELIKWSVQADDGTSVDTNIFSGELEINHQDRTFSVDGDVRLDLQMNMDSEHSCEESLQPVENVSVAVEQCGFQGSSQQVDSMVASLLQNRDGMVPETSSCITRPAEAPQIQMETKVHMPECPQIIWNPLASEFYPPSYYTFITPVACSPGQWMPSLDPSGLCPQKSSNVLISDHFSSKVEGEQRGRDVMTPVKQTPLLPSVKKKKPLRPVGKVLLLLRGAPGSGKSTLARTLLEQNPGGIVLCTDDYFCKNGQYQYDRNCLEAAHAWTQKKAKEAFEKKLSPIIIDNTNMQAWEMKPYVAMSVQHKYAVAFREPDTWWKYKPKELQRRNIHGITREKIRRMLNSYERHVSVTSIMKSSACTNPVKSDLDQGCDKDEDDGVSDSRTAAQSREEHLETSPLTYCSIRDEEKPKKTDSSSLLEDYAYHAAEDSSKAQKDMGSLKGEAAVEKCTVEQVNSVCPAREVCGELGASLENQDVKENENLDKIVVPEENAALDILCIPSITEPNDDQLLGTPFEKEQLHSTQDPFSEYISQKETDTIVPKSLRPELLNFVGDWPMEQSMGQRRQRTKKTLFSKPNCNVLKADSPHPLKNEKDRNGKSEVVSKPDSDSEQIQMNKPVDALEIQGDGCVVSMPLSLFTISHEDPIRVPEYPGTGGDWPAVSAFVQQKQLVAQQTSCNQNCESGDIFLSDSCTREGFGRPTDDAEKQEVTVTSHFQDGETMLCETNSQKLHLQTKKGGKQCKLALTFSKNSISVPESRKTLITCKSEVDMPERTHCISSQTEPLEFALLWRLEKNITNINDSTKVLIGQTDRFKAAEINVNTCADSPEKIPYRVMHDKGTRVEESELIKEDEIENLKALCKMFRSVSFDVLKDLYERCNKDIGWATNLLLDSGEKLHMDEEDEEEVEDVEVEVSTDFDADHADLERASILLYFENEETLDCTGANNENISEPVLYDETKEVVELNAGHASIEPSSSLISQHNANLDSLKERNSLISQYVYYQQSENHITSRLECTGCEIDQGSSTEEANFVISQSPSSAIKEPNCNHDKAGNIKVEISEENSDRSSVFAKPTDAHIFLEDVNKHKPNSSLRELDMQPSDDVNSHYDVNTASQSLKLDVNGQLASASFEAKISKSYRDDYEKFQSQQNFQHVGNVNNPNEYVLQPENVHVEEVHEEKCNLQEPRDHTPNSMALPYESMNIDSLQLSLPPELAFQLRELFGPVGIGLGSLTVEDCMVHIDLSLAKIIHEKWKESILERQRQEALSYQLIIEDEQFWSDEEPLPELPLFPDSKEMEKQESIAISATDSVGSERMQDYVHRQDVSEDLPFMDHWNTSVQKVSLRKIISEEVAFQEHHDLKQVSPHHRKDGAAIVKEKQLQQMFPHIDQKLLLEMFQDNNFSFEQTERFFTSMLEADPVQNIVAQKIVQQHKQAQPYRSDKKKMKIKVDEDILCRKQFQDLEDPEYADFRTEAFLHRSKQQECFRKAAEAYRRGMKEVATFYAQQGHLHGKKMKEANHLAALQIFNRVNESLLPENVLDLHGLHVDEAIKNMSQILHEKAEEYKRNGGKPYLSVITGRGNHSQGGVARIKPAVVDYLTSHSFRFKEIKPGCLQVMLK
ncbi:NEDD4-binding protein 2 isoform X2 [Ambystoma mexicanum]|uniref:NEDD4-binding protein 2 isoform X2 n=1 Tax=Ambystoma mexicanum TaxID=8296 RepID=UPI0037E84E55